ncbi:hypothetical protein AGMMS49573_08460 [Endomicrobiia bacterium]|nr:hypothetical protein AGMMS49573_08460 [Endomicrobiia bacterium]
MIDKIQNYISQNYCVKHVSLNFNKDKAEKIFKDNVITYFSSYRYESPGYLNDPYEINLEFKKKDQFSGYLRNPIEVRTCLLQLANWVMDIVLDLKVTEAKQEAVLLGNINNIFTQTLVSKQLGAVRVGIGQRSFGSTRIQIVKKETVQTVYPTIFNLSSGEAAMFCLFGEILRQADNNKNNILLEGITGIVLVDEVDKHLHIKLQKEILPKLLDISPNVQFILSSHSPFLNMGLAAVAKERAKIVELNNFGVSMDPTANELYDEVYKMMISENDRFKEA